MAPAPDELNDRQKSLLAQVAAGEVSEQQPDTHDQLLALARLGHLDASHDADGWHYSVAAGSEPEPAGEPAGEPGEQAGPGEPGEPSAPQQV